MRILFEITKHCLSSAIFLWKWCQHQAKTTTRVPKLSQSCQVDMRGHETHQPDEILHQLRWPTAAWCVQAFIEDSSYFWLVFSQLCQRYPVLCISLVSPAASPPSSPTLLTHVYRPHLSPSLLEFAFCTSCQFSLGRVLCFVCLFLFFCLYDPQ